MPIVATVEPGGPADEAGLRPGMEVLAIDGTAASSTLQLTAALENLEGAGVVELEIQDRDTVLVLTVEPEWGWTLLDVFDPDLLPSAAAARLLQELERSGDIPRWLLEFNLATLLLAGGDAPEAIRSLRTIDAPGRSGLGRETVEYTVGLALQMLATRDGTSTGRAPGRLRGPRHRGARAACVRRRAESRAAGAPAGRRPGGQLMAASGPRPDVLVVGGGLIGLLIARELFRAGARVEVADDRRAGAASPTAAGMIAPIAESSADLAFARMALLSRDLWTELAPALEHESGTSIDYDDTGAILPVLDETGRKVLGGIRKQATDLGEATAKLDRAELIQLVPTFVPGIETALLLPGEHRVDNRLAPPQPRQPCAGRA